MSNKNKPESGVSAEILFKTFPDSDKNLFSYSELVQSITGYRMFTLLFSVLVSPILSVTDNLPSGVVAVSFFSFRDTDYVQQCNISYFLHISSVTVLYLSAKLDLLIS